MSASNYADLTAAGRTMVHIPFAVGAIGIFHSVPDSAFSGANLDLDGCVLAKIFSRKITTWDHPDILALNPGLSVPAGTNIKVVHRVEGSSSTSGTTQYLNTVCPTSWAPMTTGSTVTWPADTFGAQGSGGVSTFIRENEYAIGYIDAGHGHGEGFSEIALKNKNDKYVLSISADIGAAAVTALANDVLPSDPTADWSGVNLFNQAGDDSWPITMMSYLYVNKDLSGMNTDSAALLKAFIDYILSAEGRELSTEYKFVPLPQQVLDYNQVTLNTTMIFPAGMTPFEFEWADKTLKGTGASARMISGKRQSYGMVARASLEASVEALQASNAALLTEIAALKTSTDTLSADVETVYSASVGGDSGAKDTDIIPLIALIVSALALILSSVVLCKIGKNEQVPTRHSAIPMDQLARNSSAAAREDSVSVSASINNV
jgi:ABC-type phosphate transport system substrate-binding protein